MGTATALPSPLAPRTSLASLITRETRRRRRRLITWGLVAVTALGLGAAVWSLTRPRPVPMAARFRTEPVSHGSLVREVRATGRLEAVSSISVGAQISGRIETVLVDYNDRVKAGQVLARFDKAALEAQRAQSQAMLAQAKAQLAQARFEVAQTQRNQVRSDELFAKSALTQAEHESALTAASLSEARLGAAEASVAAMEAAATVARTNLDHTVIRAPIDGIVITRNVESGQTVASMLQTPVLFTVAADLRKMEVEAAVDEADIGEIVAGQPAEFSVTAWPDRTFQGTVTEVRNSARVVQDVVTYGALVQVENPDLSLKPGMTASVRIHTGKVSDTDHLPNTALLFTPPGQARTPGVARVFVLEGGAVVAMPVTTGLSDGEATAITRGALPTGTRVLVDLTPEGKKAYGLAAPK